MAKLVVHHDTDPGIAIILSYTPPGTPGRARGWRGSCTECGHWMHRWTQEQAVETAQRHVDDHEAVLTGADIDALVRLHARRYGGARAREDSGPERGTAPADEAGAVHPEQEGRTTGD